MGKIVAIAGGSIGYRSTPNTIPLEREIIRLTGKKHPTLLLIPTASKDSPSYFDVVQKHFGKRLGCRTDVLYLLGKRYARSELEKRILGSDIIYVGGGNTKYMLTVWRKAGLDILLRKAYQKGIVLSGVSAGAGCWFQYLNSDSLKIATHNKKAPFIRVKALGLIPAFFCPHYNEPGRRSSVKAMAQKYRTPIIGLENRTALVVADNQFKILSAHKDHAAYQLSWQKEKYIKEQLPLDEWLTFPDRSNKSLT